MAPAPQAAPLTPAQGKHCLAWPVDAQRLFVAALEGFEAQGHPLPEAEALAYAKVKMTLH